jgi:phosphoribosylamine-glycine ligase
LTTTKTKQQLEFLVVSEAGDGAGIAELLQRTGHPSVLWVKDDEGNKRLYKLVDRVDEWSSVPDEAAIVLADCTGSGVLLDLLRHRGNPVVGGSLLADRLEADREYCYEVFDACGIATPTRQLFADWEEAEAYVLDRDKADRLVFKPCGGLSGNLPSYVSSNTEDMLEMLNHYSSQIIGEPEFILQDFIDGVDISTEGWFDGIKFVPSMFNHTLETKHLMDGDIGPSGGCTGNIVWAADDNPLVEEVLKLEDFLRRNDYGPGPIDLNSLVGDDGVLYGLELTPRFGYDATPTMALELYGGDFGQFLAAIAGVFQPFRGGDSQDLHDSKLKPGFAAGVRVSVAPWPSEKHPGPSGIPVRGLHSFEHFYPMDIMLDDKEELTTCGAWGIIGVATAYADSISDALDSCYKQIKKLKIPDMQYRTDLAEVFTKRFNKVKRSLSVGVL